MIHNERFHLNLAIDLETAETHLRTIQADDSIYIPGAVEEIGDCDSVFTGRYPVLLGAWVDLEDVCPRAEDGLLSV